VIRGHVSTPCHVAVLAPHSVASRWAPQSPRIACQSHASCRCSAATPPPAPADQGPMPATRANFCHRRAPLSIASRRPLPPIKGCCRPPLAGIPPPSTSCFSSCSNAAPAASPLASTSSRRTAPYGTATPPEPPSTRTPPRQILFTTPPQPDLLGEPRFRSLCPAQPPLSGGAGAKHSRRASSARPSWASFTRAQQAAMPARAGRFRPCAAGRGPI
jgi:hypothetical protein